MSHPTFASHPTASYSFCSTTLTFRRGFSLRTLPRSHLMECKTAVPLSVRVVSLVVRHGHEHVTCFVKSHRILGEGRIHNHEESGQLSGRHWIGRPARGLCISYTLGSRPAGTNQYLVRHTRTGCWVERIKLTQVSRGCHT